MAMAIAPNLVPQSEYILQKDQEEFRHVFMFKQNRGTVWYHIVYIRKTWLAKRWFEYSRQLQPSQRIYISTVQDDLLRLTRMKKSETFIVDELWLIKKPDLVEIASNLKRSRLAPTVSVATKNSDFRVVEAKEVAWYIANYALKQEKRKFRGNRLARL